MTPKRQGPVYAIFAQPLLPCCAANSASESSAKRWSIQPMVMIAPAYGSESEGNVSAAQGEWLANFERLRETKDLSAPCPQVIPPIPSFQDPQGIFL